MIRTILLPPTTIHLATWLILFLDDRKASFIFAINLWGVNGIAWVRKVLVIRFGKSVG